MCTYVNASAAVQNDFSSNYNEINDLPGIKGRFETNTLQVNSNGQVKVKVSVETTIGHGTELQEIMKLCDSRRRNTDQRVWISKVLGKKTR